MVASPLLGLVNVEQLLDTALLILVYDRKCLILVSVRHSVIHFNFLKFFTDLVVNIHQTSLVLITPGVMDLS